MKNRLTNRAESGFVYCTQCCINQDKDCVEQDCFKAILDRLAAYEDSQMTPEEVQSLAKAKADGRLKILPAKPGDIIYRPEALQFCWVITKVEIYEDEIVFIDDSDNIFRPDDIGKTVFLTHEEAEKVLEAKRRGGKKDDLQNYLKS